VLCRASVRAGKNDPWGTTMKPAVLATALTIGLCNIAVAKQDAATASGRPAAAATITLAMGPISAPQRRNPNAVGGSLPESASPSGSAERPHHKQVRHRGVKSSSK